MSSVHWLYHQDTIVKAIADTRELQPQSVRGSGRSVYSVDGYTDSTPGDGLDFLSRFFRLLAKSVSSAIMWFQPIPLQGTRRGRRQTRLHVDPTTAYYSGSVRVRNCGMLGPWNRPAILSPPSEIFFRHSTMSSCERRKKASTSIYSLSRACIAGSWPIPKRTPGSGL